MECLRISINIDGSIPNLSSEDFILVDEIIGYHFLLVAMVERRFDVYGVGNALVDYLAFVDETFLVDNGIAKGAMTLVDKPGIEKSLINHPSGYERCSGGSAANTVVGVARLGGTAAFTGKVADDEHGRFYATDMKKDSVSFITRVKDGTTGVCTSFITPDGQRSMLTFLGVSSEMEPPDIDEETIRRSRFLYVEGYQWSSDSAMDASIHAMELAKKHGAQIAFSYSDPLIAQLYRDSFLHVTREYVELLFCNTDEAMGITGQNSASGAAMELGCMVDSVCVTTGAEGAIVVDHGKLNVKPALKVDNVVDTTGAGDAYAAGVLRGLTLGRELTESSVIGSAAAAAVISQVGARLGKVAH
jgi:sugar/nucleoside kinase (ribokinase family)